MTLPRTTDVAIVGGGIVGLAVARAVRVRWPGRSVVVLEKETALAAHASGRNSGVLHAGFYYTADSLKARFSVEGNRRMAAWCQARGLAVNRCGKLVVARGEADLPGLDTLAARGAANGVRLESVTAAEAADFEPRIKTFERALWSPDTATVDPAAVTRALAEEVRELGATVATGTAWRAAERDAIRTDGGRLSAGFVVNCAGLYADRIAAAYGHGARWQIVPFRGQYLYGAADGPPLRTCVYPVPDLGMPFLGVHFTVAVDGRAKIGPTAMPALWREHYGGTSGFAARDFAEIALAEGRLLLTDPAFRGLALHELRKARHAELVRRAGELLHGVDPHHWRTWGRPGLRAQLLERATGRLEMDFVVEGDARSLHVLNAVSPAFTCSLPFGEWLCDRLPS